MAKQKKTPPPSKKEQSNSLTGSGIPQVAEKKAIPKGKMHVKIYAPFKVYYDGLAESVTALNDTGPFDILQGHHNFMTLLSTCDITVRGGTSETDEEKISINRGIMHVKKDEVTVFLDV